MMDEQQHYGISHSAARAGVPLWAMNILEQRYDGHIPISAMLDAMTWVEPAPRSQTESRIAHFREEIANNRRQAHNWIMAIRRGASREILLDRIGAAHNESRAIIRELRGLVAS